MYQAREEGCGEDLAGENMSNIFELRIEAGIREKIVDLYVEIEGIS